MSGARLLFPDTTVLINFALCDLVETLGQIAPEVGWCMSVARECHRSSREPGLEALATVRGIFGEPLMPTRAEQVNTELLRTSMASPYEPRSAHVGEAETIAIVTARQMSVVFATDDQAAARLAKAHGITPVSTWALLRVSVRMGRITADEAWSACCLLRASKRGWPNCGHTRGAFDLWLYG